MLKLLLEGQGAVGLLGGTKAPASAIIGFNIILVLVTANRKDK